LEIWSEGGGLKGERKRLAEFSCPTSPGFQSLETEKSNGWEAESHISMLVCGFRNLFFVYTIIIIITILIGKVQGRKNP
jgi:hypothetical protein